MHVSDDLFLGTAYIGGSGLPGSLDTPTRQSLGVGPLGRLYIYDIVPVALAANNICAAQAIAGPQAALINGALAANGVATLDVPRAVQVDSSSAADTTQTVLVSGTDTYGQKMSELIALNGTTNVLGAKAFKTITSVTISAAMAGNFTLGTTDVFGLPLRVSDAGYLARVGWAGALAGDAGTFVAADATPATTGTGDVRGTYVPSSAANGARRLVVGILLPALAVGPNATRVGAVGVNQA